MRRLLLTSYVVAVISVLAGSATAVTSVTTDPVGFTTMSQLSNSDTLISIPFTRPPEFTGGVSSATGNVITVSGSPWTTNQFVYAPTASPAQTNHYYVLLGPAGSAYTKEGRIYDITANSANTVTVNTTDNLSDVPAGAQVVVIPKWTLATVFPATDQNVSFTPSASSNTRLLKTKIFIPNYAAPGTNQAFSTEYYFINVTGNVGWRQVGDNPATPHDNDVLLPYGYIVVRNDNGASTLPVSPAGAVLTKKLSVPLVTQSNGFQDNSVAMVRPVDVALNNTGLGPADGSFAASPSSNTRLLTDQLFLFDNTSTALNKSPSAQYYYFNNAWRKVGDAPTNDHGPDVIPAGSAILIRKAATASGGIIYWTNSPTY